MQQAFDSLVLLNPDGIQLTPGNHPTSEFAAYVKKSGIPVRTHHSFAFDAVKRDFYRFDGSTQARTEPWSVHPPLRQTNIEHEHWFAHTSTATHATEVMYPGHWLGTGAELERAMDAGFRLAVDISHLYIQRCAGVLTDKILDRLLDYDRVEEVHVSRNNGQHDLHMPIQSTSYLLDWARARLLANTPTVIECYMHRLSLDARVEQIERLRENLS